MNFGKLFGKKGGDTKKSTSGGNPQSTIQNLDSQIVVIEGKIGHIEKIAKGYEEEAKAKLKQGDKAGAKRALLKKKKQYEQIKQLEGGLQMLEDQKMMLESMGTQVDMVKALKEGAKALKDGTQQVDINAMEDLKNDMEDIKDQQAEINDFFANYTDEQTEGVEDDLAALEEEMAKEEVGALPKANAEKIQPAETQKNTELDDLNQFLAN